MTAAPCHVPMVSVDPRDLAELILAVHTIADVAPRCWGRRGNVIDIAAPRLADVPPSEAESRYHLTRRPTAVFSVSQRDRVVDVVVDRGAGTASASFFMSDCDADPWFAGWLAEYTHDTLRGRSIASALS
ncbi:MAG: hypothetical protein J2P18_15155 [Nocardia sp.]|nr:hypothetical protein [Nocardia sp.]